MATVEHAERAPRNPALRESYLFDRRAIAEIQREVREGIYDMRGFGGQAPSAALQRPAFPGREHVALST